MISIKKVTNDIQNNGKYDAILEQVKKTLGNENPTFEEIEKLISKDKYYIAEYKDLNRWGEISSVHIQPLEIKESDCDEAKELKTKINADLEYLVLGEEYQVPSKKVIHIAWTGFVLLPAIYVIDNMVRMFTTWYITHANYVYLSFAIVTVICLWGYYKVTQNHARQHKQYTQKQQEIRALVNEGLEKNYFTYEEVYIK
jgi:hypothetical protein